MENYLSKTYEIEDRTKARDVERLVDFFRGNIIYSELSLHPSEIPGKRQITVRAEIRNLENFEKIFNQL